MKYITIYIISILFFTNVLAQEADTALTLDDLKLEADTIGFNELDIDDMLNNVFSEKMDSMMSSWDIQNRFNFDNSEVRTLNFPKDLPDSVYIKRLKEIEQVVDLSYNKVVNNYIKMYTEKRRDLVEVMLGLSAYYFPIFEETLDKYDMPLEIKYLAIIESALNPTARSRVGANGLWQFMYGTARNMKLEITSFVDERRDPIKATDAAARYLSKLHDIYGDWHLAIAAYNCGPGNVNRAIRRSGGKRNYWEIYYRLPRETRGYVPAFIAATYTFEYYKEHNLVPRYPEIELSVDTVMVNDYLHFDQVSAKLDIEKEQLRALNPMYRRDVIPAKESKPYPLVLPNDVILDFVDLDTSIFAFERDKYFPDNTLMDPTTSNSSYFTPVDIKGKAKVVYTVKAGDNVGFISSWFHVRASDLRYWNNIRRDMIRVGQKLAIYVPEKEKEKYEQVTNMSFAQKQASIGKSSTTTTRETKPLDPNYEYYTVRKGDTLWDIAQKYAGISADEIMRLNELKNDRGLYIGQKLKIKRKG
ncbi:LysM peptidoglycan-binding domain-containing protein [uncultured Draconibacterium sp.]|uniref:lytic transglycosylase domain-containing protein n=1 Tax=uncultured Draconibacterium sp. TaxID=1573823 RepID=UPI002AA80BCA|nr:LysM peptidoglycan-binding domain-containing protein [uncultured Draconibacterium sp.]